MKRYIFIAVLAANIFYSYSVTHAAVTLVTDESSWQNLVGSWQIADFEGFTGQIGDRYSNLNFDGFNGGSPFSIMEFPYEGNNSMFTVFQLHGGGGGFAAEFKVPVSGVAFWAGDVEFEGTIISVYDSSKRLLGTYDLLNDGSGNRPLGYGFNGFVSDDRDISRIELSIDVRDAVWFDNFQYSPVPIPGAVWLFGSGLIGLLGFRRKFGKG